MTEQNTLASFTMQNIAIILSLLASSIILNWLAYLHGYLTLPRRKISNPKIFLRDVFIYFFIFLGIYFLSPLLIYYLYTRFPSLKTYQTLLIPIFQLAIYSIMAFCLFLFSYYKRQLATKQIWKDSSSDSNLSSDFKMGLIFFAISFPLIMAIAQFTEILTNLLFGKVETDQNAVLYLKLALQSPWGLFFSLLSILIFAPILEEFLFRGVLQTWIRSKLGPISAIFIASFFFSLMHFSPDQSTTNVPLLITLFTLSLYLGFLYEKTRSLLASIFLHVTFNSLSVIRIIFTET